MSSSTHLRNSISALADSGEETAAELAAILEQYLEALESGRTPDRAAILAVHPHLADALEDNFHKLDALHAAATGLAGADISFASFVGEVGGAPKEIGDFRILREVGRGGMGIVYEAEQLSLGRKVALKVLPFAALLDKRQLARFQNEARAAATLAHPNIVPVHAVGEDRGVHYYAMQLVRGQSLAEAIEQLRNAECGLRSDRKETEDREQATGIAHFESSSGQQPIANCQQPPHSAIEPLSGQGLTANSQQPANSAFDTQPLAALATDRSSNPRAYFRRVAEIGIEIAKALDHAHEHGILHRDVKPANILLDNDGKAYITDFGLARLEADASMTASGDLVGTLRYMSPEQINGNRATVDHRTDVYALGATLYELAALRPVFAGESREELLREITTQEPRPLKAFNSAAPTDLETILRKTLEKDPSDRFASAADLADDLRRFMTDKVIRARPPGPVLRLSKWSHRNRTLVAALMAIAIVLGCSAVVSAVLVLRAYQREAAQRSKAEENLQLAREVIGEAFLQQAELLKDQPKMTDQQRALLEKAAAFYARIPRDDTGDANTLQESLAALIQLSQVYGTLGRHQEAEYSAERATGIAGRLLDMEPNEQEYWSLASSAYERQAISLERLGKLHKSLSAYETAIKHATKLSDQFPENAGYRFELAKRHGGLGLVYGRLSRRELPQPHYVKSSQAEVHLQTAVDVLRDLVRSYPSHDDYRRRLCTDLQNLWAYYQSVGANDEQISLLQEGRRHADLLVTKFPQNPRYQDGYGSILFNLAAVTPGDASLDLLTKCTAVYGQLSNDYPRRPAYRKFLAFAHSLLAVRGVEAADLGGAAENYEQASRLFDELLLGDPTNREYLTRYRMLVALYGDALSAIGDFDGALPIWQKGLELIRRKLPQETDAEQEFLLHAQTTYMNHAFVALELELFDEAEESLLAAIAIYEGPLAAHSHPAKTTAVAWSELGRLQFNRRRYAESVQWYDKAIEALEGVKPICLNGLAICHIGRADGLEQLGKTAAAAEAYLEALSLLDQWAHIFPYSEHPDHWPVAKCPSLFERRPVDNYPVMLLLRAKVLAKTGDRMQAQISFEKAIAWRTASDAENPVLSELEASVQELVE